MTTEKEAPPAPAGHICTGDPDCKTCIDGAVASSHAAAKARVAELKSQLHREAERRAEVEKDLAEARERLAVFDQVTDVYFAHGYKAVRNSSTYWSVLADEGHAEDFVIGTRYSRDEAITKAYELSRAAALDSGGGKDGE